jgi:large subunit ribosomal protein L10
VPEQLLSGEPVAVGFCLEEIPSVAKAITEFADEHELVEIFGGLMPERELSAAEIKVLAKLPPLDTLRAQIIGMLDAPAANLVGVLQAGVAQVINVINAYAESGEGAEAAA